MRSGAALHLLIANYKPTFLRFAQLIAHAYRCVEINCDRVIRNS
jgi:hypothetical protein